MSKIVMMREREKMQLEEWKENTLIHYYYYAIIDQSIFITTIYYDSAQFSFTQVVKKIFWGNGEGNSMHC